MVGQARSGLSQLLGGVQQWVRPGGDSPIAGGGFQTWVRPGVVGRIFGWYCVGCKVQGWVRPGGG